MNTAIVFIVLSVAFSRVIVLVVDHSFRGGILILAFLETSVSDQFFKVDL